MNEGSNQIPKSLSKHFFSIQFSQFKKSHHPLCPIHRNCYLLALFKLKIENLHKKIIYLFILDDQRNGQILWHSLTWLATVVMSEDILVEWKAGDYGSERNIIAVDCDWLWHWLLFFLKDPVAMESVITVWEISWTTLDHNK